MTSLFDSLTLGELNIPNRIIMAPLTRMRSHQPGNIPTALNATYYQQRASAGLIISEATQIIPEGQGYPATPGIHSPEQINGWSLVTQAVHERGEESSSNYGMWAEFPTLLSNPMVKLPGHLPLLPQGNTLTSSGKQVPFETPRSLSATQIAHLLNQYELAAQHAQQAGFDGVEIHGANGYLLDQFLQDGSNQRVDIYGGSVENRARLLFQVIERCVKIWGKGRGVRLSPYGTFNDMKDSDPVNLFRYVVEGICNVGLAYIHLIEPRSTSAGGSDKTDESAPAPLFYLVQLSKLVP
ncbi:alkene reductase [Cylindrospermopsis raciborskii]|uniref:oxidoreductase n=1 Tax=Cylindrospermopsis raciborskii TaxID=77022 RepID=UPI00215B3CA0|nr:alkene reductase [Cylindrospermopsis raciborskii]